MGNPWEPAFQCEGVFCPGNCPPRLTLCDVTSFRLGFYGDYVFNRHMERFQAPMHDIETTEINTNAAYLVLNLFNWVDFFAVLGTANMSVETPAGAFAANSNVPLSIVTTTDFLWGLGGKTLLWKWCGFALAVQIEYVSSSPQINFVRFDGSAPIYFGSENEFVYSEWQAALGLGYAIRPYLYPYVGVGRADAKVDMSNLEVGNAQAFLFNMVNKKDWNFLVGASLVGYNSASVTVEGRFAGEKALYVNGQMRF